jgi:hypothetical protein
LPPGSPAIRLRPPGCSRLTFDAADALLGAAQWWPKAKSLFDNPLMR